MQNALTIDLEDWYHGLTSTNRQPDLWPQLESRVVRTTERLLTLLDDYQTRATFFVLAKVAEEHPEIIKRIAAAGHEIGVHGYAHRMISRMTPADFSTELDLALALLQPLTQGPIIGHRAPYFSINQDSLWALDILLQKGLCYDSSFFPTRNMLYGYPQAPRFPHRPAGCNGLMEFPASTVRFLGVTWPVAGGFYVRTLPYALLRWAFSSLNRQNQPVILYLHPWELDLDQPMAAATLRERITHYHGRASLGKKLGKLLSEFDFLPLRDLLPAGE